MVFSDPLFLFIFLPVALAVILITRANLYYFCIFISSLIFYFWGAGYLVALLIASAVVNWIAGLMIAHTELRATKKIVIAFAITFNLGLLLYFKYAFFVASNLFISIPEQLDFLRHILLPIGISFFTFQGISYLVDIYRDDINADRNFLRFGAYLTFFPQLIAGPIVRYADVQAAFKKPDKSVENFALGATRFFHGLLKKVLIADTAGAIADSAFSTPSDQLTLTVAWIGAIAYTIQIYFDFSGYSDMAIGIGKMCGVRFPENFRHPYSSSTVTDFWRRWHITLSSWFRDYAYIPLGGNRAGALLTYRNLIFVFLLTGIWHGAAWTFIVWGLYHGLFLILERRVFNGSAGSIRSTTLRFCYLLPVIVFGWVIFRAPDLGYAGAYILAMIDIRTMFGAAHAGSGLADFGVISYAILVVSLAILFAPRDRTVGEMIFATSEQRKLTTYGYGLISGLASLFLAITSNYSPFLYFQF